MRKFGLRISAAVVAAACLSNCLTLRDLSTNETDAGLRIDPAGVLPIAYVHKEVQSGNPPHVWFGYINNCLSMLTLGMLWPLPVDVRVLPAPALWEQETEKIMDAFEPELTKLLNQKLARNSAPIEPSGPSTIRQLRALARSKGKRYLYLVRLNTYRRYESHKSYGSYSVTTKYSGFVAAGSRVLIDVESGKRVLTRERMGEKYVWWLFLSNGFSNDLSNGFFSGNSKSDEYGRQVGALFRSGAMAKIAAYIYKRDFAGLLAREAPRKERSARALGDIISTVGR